MLEERALVIGLKPGEPPMATVRTQRLSACDSCQLKTGCGTHSLAKLAGNQSMEFDLENALGAQEGDVVLVAIPEQGLILASLMMYIVPLITMFSAVITLKAIADVHELWLLLAALVGLAVGAVLVRLSAHKRKDDPRLTPRMTHIALREPEGAACRSL
ncbi:MAG: SoxR reducing system RseC family protein [Oleiphilaceae bacterium]|nr:SoxR reducing system RseC family protein [Oleiphilaceae bacterium]